MGMHGTRSLEIGHEDKPVCTVHCMLSMTILYVSEFNFVIKHLVLNRMSYACNINNYLIIVKLLSHDINPTFTQEFCIVCVYEKWLFSHKSIKLQISFYCKMHGIFRALYRDCWKTTSLRDHQYFLGKTHEENII